MVKFLVVILFGFHSSNGILCYPDAIKTKINTNKITSSSIKSNLSKVTGINLSSYKKNIERVCEQNNKKLNYIQEYNTGSNDLINNFWPINLEDSSIDIKLFGAKGDGTTDDYLAFQNAINSTAKEIYVPKGIYLINKSLIVNRSDLSIKGEGNNSIIQKNGDGTFQNIFSIGIDSSIECSSIKFKNLKFLSNGKNSRVYGINTSYATEVDIENCSFESLATGIKFSGTRRGKNFEVTNCSFSNSYLGVYSNCPNTRVIGCVSNNIGSDFIIGKEDERSEKGHGPVVYFGTTLKGAPFLEGMFIKNCKFETGKNAAIKLANCSVSLSDIKIDKFLYGITISNCDFEITNIEIKNTLTSKDAGVMRIAGSSGFVKNSKIINSKSYGIYCLGGEEVSILNSEFENENDSITSKAIIICYGVKKFKVENCKFINTKNMALTNQSCILITKHGTSITKKVEIINNYFINAANANYIYLRECDTGIIQNNTIQSSKPLKKPGVAIHNSIKKGNFSDNTFNIPNNNMYYFPSDIRQIEIYNNRNSNGFKNKYQSYDIRNGNIIHNLSNIPESGYFQVGDKIINTNPKAKGISYWICIKSGIAGKGAKFKSYK